MKLPSLSKKVLSIDFGADEIKIIEGQGSKKGINISKAFTVDLPKDVYHNGEILDQVAIVSSLKTSLKENKVSTNLTYGIINSSSIITREVSIPKVPEKEIASIINYQLDNFLPVDPEDYVVNHIVLGNNMEEEVEKLDILLVGVPKKMVLNHLDLIKEVGLKPEVLDFQSNSMAKLLEFNSMVNDYYTTRDVAIASVDMGYDSSKLTIIKNGKIEVSRVIDVGAKTVYENLSSLFDYSYDEREDKVRSIEDINASSDEFDDYFRMLNITRTTLDNLLEKIEVVFRYYTSRQNLNFINYILLQGGFSNIEGIESLFSSYFNIPTVKLSSLDKIKWKGDFTKYANAIGGLIRNDEVQR